MTSFDLTPFLLTFKLALVTTLILVVIGIPLAYWLAFSSRWFKYPVEALVSMPLVLPPTVLGFYILLSLGPRSLLGGLLENVFDIRIVFSFTGLAIGSVIFSLPFMVNPIKAGFEGLPKALVEASATLGKTKRETFFKVLLPNNKPAIISAVLMSFAHTVGEFGVVLMIGGNIPGLTQTASIVIFNEVEALNIRAANFYSLIMVAVSFLILFFLSWQNKYSTRQF